MAEKYGRGCRGMFMPLGPTLVPGSEILPNCPLDTDCPPKTKVGALQLEKWGLKFETPPHEYRSL